MSCSVVIVHVHSLGREAYPQLVHGEQRPELGAEVDAVEAGEGEVVAVESHAAAEDGAAVREGEVQHGELTAGDVLQDLWG